MKTVSHAAFLKSRLESYRGFCSELDRLNEKLKELDDKLLLIGSPHSVIQSDSRQVSYGNAKEKAMLEVITQKTELEKQLSWICYEINDLDFILDCLPDYAKDRYSEGYSWQDLEDKYGLSRQNMDYVITSELSKM